MTILRGKRVRPLPVFRQLAVRPSVRSFSSEYYSPDDSVENLLQIIIIASNQIYSFGASQILLGDTHFQSFFS
ncbi:hypothetical protein Tco_1078345 [Tanacetum coccineum]|uniref:Uncharacterized protein n=1 Tax=Tanacetum coccineum TaxID=301880 RepID=A0ABQ5HNU1_9ASTR